jgi:hypothetical protein
VRGLRPHPRRGGSTSFGHLECEGGSERSGSVSKRVHLFPCKTPILAAFSIISGLRTGESLQIVCARPSPTSTARREHQLWAPGVRGWVRTVRFCEQKGAFISMQNTHSRCIQHHIRSPHRRITADSLCAAFAHIHGEAGAPALGTWSARVGPNGPVL